MDEITSVEDDEELYRSVRSSSSFDEYRYDDDGHLAITYRAFQDRNRSPSVDRAILRDNNPFQSKLNEKDGIVSLIVGEVRKIGNVATRIDDKVSKSHAVDVLHRPKTENYSHSQIEVIPAFFSSNNKRDKAFKLLRLALARLATSRGWTLEPE